MIKIEIDLIVKKNDRNRPQDTSTAKTWITLNIYFVLVSSIPSAVSWENMLKQIVLVKAFAKSRMAHLS